ncbi:polysaccharide export protein EpsE [Niveibacterium sp. SC-1]|uniref:polysaccharide export protein EpsE n=1 Tax=Niveibacterium sp. SC-1 TaxID=3135646 RepID=UPI00311FCCC6
MRYLTASDLAHAEPAPGFVRRLFLGMCALLLVSLAHAQAAQSEGAPKSTDAPEYAIGAGDVLRVSVFQNPDLTLETRVSENGSISYPLVGTVSVGGESLSAAEKKIAQRLKDGGFVVQPQVTIFVLQIHGNQVAVLGQVNKPGRYPLDTANSHLSDLLATAGGIASTGADVVIFTGVRGGKPVRREIDIASMFLSNERDNDIVMQAGDILYVHRAPVFYIYGEVQRPGVFRLERGVTVMQALATGGGLTAKGTQRGVRIQRRDPQGKVLAVEPLLDEQLRPDDVVYVKESIF